MTVVLIILAIPAAAATVGMVAGGILMLPRRKR